jgi:hypothetical protein
MGLDKSALRQKSGIRGLTENMSKRPFLDTDPSNV